MVEAVVAFYRREEILQDAGAFDDQTLQWRSISVWPYEILKNTEIWQGSDGFLWIFVDPSFSAST